MFLDGTYHVLLIFIVAGLILCVPPLILPQWKSLVRSLNNKKITNKKLLQRILISFGLALYLIATTLITFHNELLIGFVAPTPEEHYIFFNFYTFFSFILLPLGLAMIGCASFTRHSTDIKLGNFFIILIALFALGLAGSFFHDVLYCATRTQFFTIEVNASYDLVWWQNTFQVESSDYRVFGFYMLVLTIVLISYAAVLLWKLGLFSENDQNKSRKGRILLYSGLIILVFGVSLYITEYRRIYNFIHVFISVYVGIPLSLLLSHYLGKNLAEPQNKSREV